MVSKSCILEENPLYFYAFTLIVNGKIRYLCFVHVPKNFASTSSSSSSRACLLATHPQGATPRTTTSFLRSQLELWSLTASPINSHTPDCVPPVMIQVPVIKKGIVNRKYSRRYWYKVPFIHQVSL